MRRFLLASTLALVPLSALAQGSHSMQQISRPVAGMAAGCMADCLSGQGRAAGPAAHAPRMCQLRCDAATRFNIAQMRPVAEVPSARRGRPGTPGVQLVTAAMPGVAAAAAPAAAPAAAQAAAPAAVLTFSVIFTARTPSRGFGLVAGDRDRLGAHRRAEEQCRVDGAGCRSLMEAPAACGAVAHGIMRHPYAFIMTSDPSTWVVNSMSGGFGASQATAEAEALADCRSRDPRATCRVVAARCGAGQS